MAPATRAVVRDVEIDDARANDVAGGDAGVALVPEHAVSAVAIATALEMVSTDFKTSNPRLTG